MRWHLAQAAWSDVPSWLSTLGTWIAAIGTWMAAAGAIAAAIVYYFLLHGELKKRHEEAEDSRKLAAKRTSAWMEGDRLVAQNRGEEPIYNVIVFVGEIGDDFDASIDNLIRYRFSSIGPDDRRELPLRKSIERGTIPRDPDVAIEFTDCSGQHWRRESSGGLKEMQVRRPCG